MEFVFLEILDPEINSTLFDIKQILTGKRPKRPIHLTIRGPYDQRVPQDVLEQCQKIMQYDVIRISDVGKFHNPGEEVVYFRVDSPNLREIWWKPDYPIEKYGFEPHVSLYRGPDKHLADIVADFLEKEEIEMLCAEFRIVSYLHQQMELFPPPTPISENYSRHINSKRIKPDFLSRLKHLISSYNQE